MVHLEKNELRIFKKQKRKLFFQVIEDEDKIYENIKYNIKSFSLTEKIQFEKLSCGLNHILSISVEKKLFSFGSNNKGQCGQEENIDIIQKPNLVPFFLETEIFLIDCGLEHSIVITLKDNKVFSFGNGNYGSLGNGSKNLKSQFKPYHIAELDEDSIDQLTCGYFHNLLFSEKSNQLFSFGWGLYNQLGTGTTDDQPLPCLIEIEESPKIKQISSNAWHNLILTENGQVYSFGWNKFGSLGHGDEMGRKYPTKIQFFSDKKVVQISTGTKFSVVLTDLGELYIFGLFENEKGEEEIFLSPHLLYKNDSKKIKQIFSKFWSFGCIVV